MRKIVNLILYWKWSDCKHNNKDVEVLFGGMKCNKCGLEIY